MKKIYKRILFMFAIWSCFFTDYITITMWFTSAIFAVSVIIIILDNFTDFDKREIIKYKRVIKISILSTFLGMMLFLLLDGTIEIFIKFLYRMNVSYSDYGYKYLYNFIFIMVQNITFFALYIFIIFKQNSENISKYLGKTLFLCKILLPDIFFIIFWVEIEDMKFFISMGIYLYNIYLLLFFTMLLISISSLKKYLESYEKMHIRKIISVTFLLINILGAAFIVFLSAVFFMALFRVTMPHKNLEAFSYIIFLIILLFTYLIVYFKFKRIALGKSMFLIIKISFYLFLFISYVLSIITTLGVDIYDFKIISVINKYFYLNFKSIISTSSKEALLTFVIFDSIFENICSFFESTKEVSEDVRKASKST
ncbi:Uncharacterised protein [Clostridioides difficile]|uniref:hypothetical protein n=1 Tax=Clostridioides difficile TaxID=1496 RepID=UPI001025A794|nr:hypothetical protein [Clostridioides difficile]VFF93643.1 Uncharacterised protein [Clostridioides difficile]VIG16280.1 Uncharacterised protein [Clostridioides difficile]HBF4772715.1 hypothetical protein [Clostridioides difficile]HBF5038264.1 hypothetical protein [Clostridioides difficile]HBF5411122.1 hypothetical protein [Clostridioides difficile]